MAAFPSITPAYDSQETINQESERIKLGDGYEQRVVRGLPANKRLITLSLKFRISESEANTINTFLNARFDDQDHFTFTAPGHSSALKYICTRRNFTRPYLNRVEMNLIFEQVAEP